MLSRPSSGPSSLADDQKISGWLALVALGVVLSSLSSLVVAVGFAVDLIGELGRGHGLGLGLELGVGSVALAAVLVQGVWGLTCFGALMARKRRAIPLLLWYSGVLLVVRVLTGSLSPVLSLLPEGSASLASFQSSLVAPALWIPYLLLSRRVRRVFVL